MMQMRLFKLLLVLFACAAATPAAAGTYEDAEAAYDKGDFTTALRLYRPLADSDKDSRSIEADIEALYVACLLDIGRMSMSGGLGDGMADIIYPEPGEARAPIVRTDT